MITRSRTLIGRWREWAVLAAASAAGIFLWFYVSEVLTPYWRGPNPGQVPWKGFADQSLYLRSAQAFADLNFDPARHHYPPLYFLVAAPFVGLFPIDPFVFVDAICVAASAALLVTLFGEVIGGPLAAICALGFLLLPKMMLETFVTPWTSTFATLLVFLGLWRLARIETAPRVSLMESGTFSLILGLVVPTRPLDAIAAASLYPFWLRGVWRSSNRRTASDRVRHLGLHLLPLVVGGLIGPAILFGVNLLIYGGPFSPYVRGFGGTDIFSWATTAEKFVSLFLDSASLYVEPGHVVFRRFPWMLAALFAIPICLLLGSWWLRAAALAAALQVALYVPFDDLLPNGLYRYFNYHYFRWAFWLGFMMIPASVTLVRQRFGMRGWLLAPVVAAGAAALACLQMSTTESTISTGTEGGRIKVLLPTTRVDYVDFPGLTADWGTGYLPGQNVWLDGRHLLFIYARFLQTATGTRLLFVRPVHGGTVELSAAQWRGRAPTALVGSRQFALGFPSWLNERPASLALGVPLRLDGMVSDLMFESGFGGFDGRGRLIAARDAVLALPLPLHAPQYRLHLRLEASEQTGIALSIDGVPSSRTQPMLVGPGDTDVAIDIPPTAVSKHALTRVRLQLQEIGGSREAQPVTVLGVTLETA